jgi:hypothetical protein
MNPTFDVFELRSDKRLVWVERFQGMEEAKQYAEKVRPASETKYVIYSVKERRIVQQLAF